MSKTPVKNYFKADEAAPDVSIMRTILKTPSLFLLMALVLQILITPFENAEIIEMIMQIVVVISALGVSADSRRHLFFGLALAIPGTALLITAKVIDNSLVSWCAYGFFLVFYLHVIRLMLRQVFLARVVTIRTIGTALCIYVLLGALWMLFYIPLEAVQPGSFSVPEGTEAGNMVSTLNYFSFVTLTTLGYGDVQPISPIARSLAVLEALTGVLFLAVLISRLVGTYRQENDKPD